MATMSSELEPAQLAGRRADEQLLDRPPSELPADAGVPPGLPSDPRRAAVVGAGATLTGLSLVAGAVLIVLGVVELIGGSSGSGLPALIVGIALVATHWGWVHVAEFTANGLESAHQRGPRAAQEAWLGSLEPYPRWTVATTAQDDGSILIERACLRPVPVGEDRFTFVREPERRELHDADEPSAGITERAELLRRQAAEDTEAARRGYEAVATSRRHAELEDEDELERRAVARAASEALSEQINRNLGRPPLE
jgi:hypothetical protein